MSFDFGCFRLIKWPREYCRKEPRCQLFPCPQPRFGPGAQGATASPSEEARGHSRPIKMTTDCGAGDCGPPGDGAPDSEKNELRLTLPQGRRIRRVNRAGKQLVATPPIGDHPNLPKARRIAERLAIAEIELGVLARQLPPLSGTRILPAPIRPSTWNSPAKHGTAYRNSLPEIYW